jgi:hypothetical protein
MSSFATTGLYGFYFFIMITFIYFAVKYFIGDSLIVIILYYLALIVGQYFINLSTTMSICGQYQYVTAIISTLIPWAIIFGLLSIILKIFPGWLSPFSNTIGYLITSLAGIGNLFNKLLVSKESNVDRQLIENIYNDKSLLINEITTDNIQTFWNKMIRTNIFKPENEISIYYNELLKLVRLKEIIAELTWYLLSGILISCITYNYILNTDCDKSENIKELQDEYVKENKDFLASNEIISSRLYKSTE